MVAHSWLGLQYRKPIVQLLFYQWTGKSESISMRYVVDGLLASLGTRRLLTRIRSIKVERRGGADLWCTVLEAVHQRFVFQKPCFAQSLGNDLRTPTCLYKNRCLYGRIRGQ